ncbi:MAG: ubiquinone biosynthesis hydroxylase [Rhizobiaceae bacterium]
MRETNVDILIAGAGYVGISCAVAIKTAAPHLTVKVVDAAPPGVWEKDSRSSAIAAAAVRMLRQLGVWEVIEPEAQVMGDMIVTDSRANDPVRPVFLTFEGDREAGEPFAYMVPNVAMNRALRRKAAEIGVSVTDGMAASAIRPEPASMTVTLANGDQVSARLLVAADGVKSRLRAMAGIKVVHFDYGQSGIVVEVAHERPHNGRAEEHFMPGGPFAILPLKGNRSSLVWTERTAEADRLVASDPLVFEAELERRFGHKLGEIKVDSKPKAFPLGLTLARDFVKPRLALIGDAAHGIHPISGQGLNLGFRDVAALAETIVDAVRLGQDFGQLDVLERYQQWRRFDTVRTGMTTDVLNRLFSNDIAPLRLIRDVGLGLVDRMPRLKDFFIQQASGIVPGAPKLLKGEAI